jgi:hypothetical protein
MLPFVIACIIPSKFTLSFSIRLKVFFCGKKINDGQTHVCYKEFVPSLDLGSILNSYSMSIVDMMM